MLLKVYIDTTTNKVVKVETMQYKEVVVENLSHDDTIVVDEKTWDIVRLQDSTQGIARKSYLLSKEELTDSEKSELDVLCYESETAK